MESLVADDADDRAGGAPEANLLADRILAGEEPGGRRLVHDQHRRRARRVGVAQQPTRTSGTPSSK